LIAGTTDRVDEPFLLQTVQGAPNRSTAQPHACHDGAFGDARPGGQLPGHDQRPQLPIDARDIVHGLMGRRAPGAV